jgi:hypothetical protein
MYTEADDARFSDGEECALNSEDAVVVPRWTGNRKNKRNIRTVVRRHEEAVISQEVGIHARRK